MEVGNVDVFLESCTIASACNKVLLKRFLKPETVGFFPVVDTLVIGITVRRLSCGYCIWNRRTTAQYNMLETVENTEYPYCLAIVSRDIAPKPEQFMNLWGVSTTGIPATRYATSKHGRRYTG
jgi:hypothetical protein